MTLTLVVEHLTVELSLPVFMTYVCPDWNRTPNTQMQDKHSTTKPPRGLGGLVFSLSILNQ